MRDLLRLDLVSLSRSSRIIAAALTRGFRERPVTAGVAAALVAEVSFASLLRERSERSVVESRVDATLDDAFDVLLRLGIRTSCMTAREAVFEPVFEPVFDTSSPGSELGISSNPSESGMTTSMRLLVLERVTLVVV